MTLLVGYLWVYGSLIRKGAVKYVISTVLLLHHSKGTLSVNRNKVFNYFLLQLSSWAPSRKPSACRSGFILLQSEI